MLPLRSMTAAQADALNQLFHGRETLSLAGEPVTTWRFAPPAGPIAGAVRLRGSNEDVSISLREDGWREPTGAREWWDYEGESRLLAWSLAHGMLLGALGRMFDEEFLPTAWGTFAATAQERSIVALDFFVGAGEGRTAAGRLELTAARAARLAAHAGWQMRADIAAPWHRLPSAVTIELPALALSAGELAACATGDVLVLGKQTRCWSNLRLRYRGGQRAVRQPCRLDGSLVWSARYEARQIEIAAGKFDPPLEMTMSQTQTSLEAAPAGALGSVPVTLEFEVGSLCMPLGELAALEPGHIFQLPARLEEARVLIRANGTLVGRGELVAVGDTLAVQLLALDVEEIR